jgi:hypothetical protein
MRISVCSFITDLSTAQSNVESVSLFDLCGWLSKLTLIPYWLCFRLIKMMYSPAYFPHQRWHVPKEQERNFVAAFFHMATIALTCTSLAQLGWFRLKGGHCAPHLAVYQFFSFGYFDSGARQADLQFRAREVVKSPVPIQYHSPSGSKSGSLPHVWDKWLVFCMYTTCNCDIGIRTGFHEDRLPFVFFCIN